MMTGICRTYTSHTATGNAEKIIIEIRENDGSITSYKVQAQQLEGMTEEQINAALVQWLDFNYPNWQNDIGLVGVHVNRDGSFCLWTGSQPTTWPEDDLGI